MWRSTSRRLDIFKAEPGGIARLGRVLIKLPVYFYRYMVSPFIGPHCRHYPTCSVYALDAIDLNGAWAGGWLALFRFCRCHPWGTSGFDPAPDLRRQTIPFWAPWRYARFRPRG
jgi:putative membrane protein insertion efficiency factor